jgi:hypothetical protein
MNPLRLAWALLLLLLAFTARGEALEVTLPVASGAEIVSQRYPATGTVIALWLTGQYGRSGEEEQAAAGLAAKGVETWLVDFLAPYFLPQLSSSWNQVPERDLCDLLEQMRQRNPGKRIVLIATGHTAALALRAGHEWQLRHPGKGELLSGALLLWPLLYQELAPGAEPEYDPVVRQARMDLVILQPKSSAGYWWRERLKGYLEEAGSRVLLNVLPGLRDGFYRRGDITPRETDAAAHLGDILLEGLKTLIDKDRP